LLAGRSFGFGVIGLVRHLKRALQAALELLGLQFLRGAAA
jgi:hypothetical protein